MYPDRFGQVENGMVQRGWGRHEEDEPEEHEHSDLFDFAVELCRVDWERIKIERWTDVHFVVKEILTGSA